MFTETHPCLAYPHALLYATKPILCQHLYYIFYLLLGFLVNHLLIVLDIHSLTFVFWIIDINQIPQRPLHSFIFFWQPRFPLILLKFRSPFKLTWAESSSEFFWSSVCPSVNFSHFHLLQNHWANFNQTCHKASLGGGDSSLYKWRATPFSKGR